MPPTRYNPPRPADPRPAFTLVELLVTISIIVILAGITFPVIGALQDGSRESSAINAISAAVDTARNFATRGDVGGFDDVDDNGIPDPIPGGSYSGAAIVFTPGGELRIVENDPAMQFDNGDYLELELAASNGVHNGYRDVPGRDYVLLPDRIGVAAVLRNNGSSQASTGGLQYLPAPFAMRFDENGSLINRQGSGGSGPFAEDGHVYYDADADDDVGNALSDPGYNQRNPFGGAPYDPVDWDWRGNAGTTSAGFVGSPPRRQLPFEQLTPVVVIAVFDLAEFRLSGGWTDFTMTSGQDRIDMWMQANARFVFFNRATGVVAR